MKTALILLASVFSVSQRVNSQKPCDGTEFHWQKPLNAVNTAYAVPLLTDGAACLDGSPPMIYVRKGTKDEDKDKFVLFFQGGGWCIHYEGEGLGCEQTCLHRSKTDKGSSVDYPPYATLSGDFWGGFRENWTHVYIRYCDGSSYTSNLDNPITVIDPETRSKVNLYFRGKRILQAMMTKLINDFDIGQASELMIAGCSAGGLTVNLHGDWIVEQVTQLSSNLERTGLVPNSGYFMEYESEEQKYVSSMKWVFSNNATYSVPNECLTKYRFQPWKCIFSPNVSPFIQTRLFPIQSQYDSWQSHCILGSDNEAEMNAYGQNLSLSLINTVLENNNNGPLNGAFLDSCSHHCMEWDKIVVDGLDYDQALQKWFYSDYPETNGNFHYQNRDYPCPECC